jgi:hypothetical protein
MPSWHSRAILVIHRYSPPASVASTVEISDAIWQLDTGDDSDKYNFRMARGWESKSVEEQQAEAAATRGPRKTPLTPEQIARQRQRQGLVLSRQRVLQQLEIAKSPRHREILQNSLADLDAQLARLG